MKGFTLVELLLSLAVLAGLTALAISTLFSSSPATAVRSGAEQLAADIRMAQNLAVTERARYRVVLAPGSSSYLLQRRDPVSGTWGAPPGVQTPDPLPDGVTVFSINTLTDDTVVFDSLGAPYEGAAGAVPLSGSGAGGMDRVVLRSARGTATAEVTIAPGAGRVDALW
jgi:prepilin-type N-terminal cleavage/methylation domain-containing protein